MRRIELGVLLLLAVLTNFTYLVVSNGDFFYPDSATYLGPARMLLGGHGFATAPGIADTLRTPGYPIFLMPFVAATSSGMPIVFVQHLLNVALTAAIWLFAVRRLGSRLIAFIAAFLFAVDTPTIHYANKVLTETLFTAVLFLAFVLAVQRKHPILLGLLLGVLTLTRPVAIAYFIVVAIALQLKGRALVTFLVAALLLPLAWATRNAIEAGELTVSRIGSSNLLMYRAAGALAMERGGNFDETLALEQKRLQATPESLADEEPRFALRVLAQHPRGLLLVTLRGIRVNLFDSDWDAVGMVSEFEDETIEPLITYENAAMVILAFIGIAFLWRSDRRLALLLGGTILYFVLISAGGESESRFRVPIVPYFALGAAVAIQRMASASRIRISRGGSSMASAIAFTTLRSFTG